MIALANSLAVVALSHGHQGHPTSSPWTSRYGAWWRLLSTFLQFQMHWRPGDSNYVSRTASGFGKA